MPPMTTIATSASELSTKKSGSPNGDLLDGAGEQGAAEPGDEPGQRERSQLRDGRAHRVARCRVGVVAHGEGDPADTGPAQPAEHAPRRPPDGEDDAVVGALIVEVETEAVDPRGNATLEALPPLSTSSR